MTDVPAAAITLIKTYEGFSRLPYHDPIGVLTIGYGHVVLPGEKFTEITEDEATALLVQDASLRARWITETIKVPLNDNQFAALISLVFNVGVAPIDGTLGKMLNAGQYEQAAEEFPRWCHAKGQTLPGLAKRRQAERELFLTPIAFDAGTETA